MRNTFISLFIISCISMITGAYTGPPKHIVYALLDDIGWSDISATGGQFPTPVIDNLYNDGIVLNRHYIHYLCSPSRAQFLTGRRCFNMGYGKMQPWGYTQVGALPVGQPTIANWFRDFVAGNTNNDIPKYETYGLGKWHIGYASEYNTPQYKGFDHYYGFYQSGVNYEDKSHFKGDYWGVPNLTQFDFFEDEVPAWDAISTTENTMDLYLDKIEEYLDDFIAVQANNPNETMNMYLYLGVQTLHGPLTRVHEYTQRCKGILDKSDGTYSNARLRVCEYTFMTDDWIDVVVQKLKDKGLWDDTLFIFTGDNGGDIDVGSCNYPLRGTKSTMFEGNIRQITFINGGNNIIPTSSRGSVRDSLISNLDWTPTLLSFAGILPYIDENDYEWDGLDVIDIILNGDTSSERSQLLLNVESPDIASIDDITSASIIFRYEWTTPKGVVKGDGKYYKYVIADTSDVDKNWVTMRNDGWCTINYTNNNSIYVIDVADSDYSTSAEIAKSGVFLFDLDSDEGEKFNLIFLEKINGGMLKTNKKNKIVKFARDRIEEEIATQLNQNFYHSPIDCFWTYQQEGDPRNFEYQTPVHGLVIEPFFDTTTYINYLQNCFNALANTSYPVPNSLQDLYLNEWIIPNALSLKQEQEYDHFIEKYAVNLKKNGNYDPKQELNNKSIQIFGVIAFIIVALFCSVLYRKRDNYGKGEYQPLIEDRVPEYSRI